MVMINFFKLTMFILFENREKKKVEVYKVNIYIYIYTYIHITKF